MYRLVSRIVFHSARRWEIDKVSEIEIVRDTDSLTDTCRITLPKKMKWIGEDIIPISKGDRVEVSVGYDDNLQMAFSGYVRDVGFKTPVVITAEDEMFRLKTMATRKLSYPNVTVSELLGDQLQGYDIRVFGSQSLGCYRVTSDTVASLLGELKNQGVKSFFRYSDGKAVLYAGVLFDRGLSEDIQVFSDDTNIIDYSSLEWKRADTMRIKVKAVSIMPDNSKIKAEVGDKDGEVRTLHTYNKNAQELKEWADGEVSRLKKDGMSGSFTTFGFRLVDKLDIIGIRLSGQRRGRYTVKKNTITYSSSGLRQKIEIDSRVGE